VAMVFPTVGALIRLQTRLPSRADQRGIIKRSRAVITAGVLGTSLEGSQVHGPTFASKFRDRRRPRSGRFRPTPPPSVSMPGAIKLADPAQGDRSGRPGGQAYDFDPLSWAPRLKRLPGRDSRPGNPLPPPCDQRNQFQTAAAYGGFHANYQAGTTASDWLETDRTYRYSSRRCGVASALPARACRASTRSTIEQPVVNTPGADLHKGEGPTSKTRDLATAECTTNLGSRDHKTLRDAFGRRTRGQTEDRSRKRSPPATGPGNSLRRARYCRQPSKEEPCATKRHLIDSYLRNGPYRTYWGIRTAFADYKLTSVR